ncbi:hypothetical protein ANCCAN_05434 [Ancylostoma caninum]|uniref:Uncharacterized protein n=1 Tax=Ancylostoma caninum TaxID=29170 RepID=A0A368GYK1_ANCCA|nr:hypothetical protein ANCCAN_05434 [Ancylostoma caninum]
MSQFSFPRIQKWAEDGFEYVDSKLQAVTVCSFSVGLDVGGVPYPLPIGRLLERYRCRQHRRRVRSACS